MTKKRKFLRRKPLWPVLLAISLIALLTIGYFGSRNLDGNLEKENDLPKDQAGRADGLLRNMTLEEKVGQVIISYFTGPELTDHLAKELCELHLGGIILYTSSGNIENPAQVAALTEKIQKSAVDSGVLPLFISIDQEGGSVARLTEGVTVFPGNMALGAVGSPELAGRSATVTARELRTMGINFNFAPVVDVNNNPDNPVIGVRSFGSDPGEVARLGAAMVKPYLKEGVLATAKHFPGHGNTDVDSHYGLPFIPYDLARLQNTELIPFQAMIREGVPAVMMAHILVPGLTGSDGLPASLSAQAARYLRQEMDFQGLIVTDSMGMGAITENWGLGEAAVMAFQAGVDLILFGPWTGIQSADRQEIYSSLLGAVKNGTISMERLDQSVRRIIAAKIEYRIIDDPLPRQQNLADLASPENQEIARRIARESMTLAKDCAGIFPLSVKMEIPLIWPAEHEETLATLLSECPFLEPHLLPLQPSAAEAGEIHNLLADFPLVLVATYNLRQYPAWIGLINDLNTKTQVALLALASPYDLLAVPEISACLCTYSDSPASVKAMAEVLNGTLAPRGRLPVELPGLD